MSLVIAVVNPKGGVGKTTTAINLAASLASIQRPTLLIDMDPDGASSVGLGFERSAIHGGLLDVFTGRASLASVVHQTTLPYLHFIPGNIWTSDDEVSFLEAASDRRLLQQLLTGFEHEQYEFVLLDCPPLLTDLTINSLVAADTALIPVTPGQFAVKALVRLAKLIRLLRDRNINTRLTVAGFLITMFDGRTRIANTVVDNLRTMFKHLVFNTHIPMNTKLNEANYNGQPVILYDRASAGSKAYMNATLELLTRLGYTPKRRGDIGLEGELIPPKKN
jgi:chromosome partitioning protein